MIPPGEAGPLESRPAEPGLPTPDGTQALFSRLRRRRTVGRLLAEMAVIVLSVLLALAASEWAQGAQRRATVRAVLETVRAEAVANRAEAARALEHHASMVSQLRSGGIEMARFDLRTAPVDTSSVAAFGRSMNAIIQGEAAARGEGGIPPFQPRRLSDGNWLLESPMGSVRVEIRGDTAVVRGTGNITLSPPFLVESAWETAQLTQAAIHMDPAIVAAMARVRQLQRYVDGTVSRLVDMLYGNAARVEPLSALSDLASFEEQLVAAYDELLGLLPPGHQPRP
jgi:hypothetical protein